MRRIHLILPSAVLLLASTSSMMAGDPANPSSEAIWVREISPAEAKAGDVLSAYGDNLNAARVLEFYLTDGKTDFKMEVLEQTKTMIRFRLPVWLPAGKMRAVVMSDEHMMLEQPAYVRIIAFPGPSTGA